MSETDAAVARARSARAGRVGLFYDHTESVDAGRSAARIWTSLGPRVGRSAAGDPGPEDGRERSTRLAFERSADGVDTLMTYVRTLPPPAVEAWIPEVDARLQEIDDLCLDAARR